MQRQQIEGARQIACVVVLVAIVLAGCTSGNGGPTPSASPSPTVTPSPTPDGEPRVLPPEDPRDAFKSDCALNVLECSGSRPVPKLDIVPGPDQFVTYGEFNIVVVGQAEDGLEVIQLDASRSVPGSDADEITYSWSYGATDDNRTTFTPGFEFSTEVDPVVRMGVGFHYIRLIVRNGTQPALPGWTPDDLQANFFEIEIEIRNSPGGGEP